MSKYCRTHALVRALSPWFRRLSNLLDRVPRVSADSYNLENLENRQLLSGAVVTIAGTADNDHWYVRVNPSDVGELQIFSGDSADGDLSRVLDRFDLSQLTFNGAGGNDKLTLDLTNGTFSKDTTFTLNFAAGSATDELVITGRPCVQATYSPSDTRGTGAVTIGQRTISFNSVANVTVTTMQQMTIDAPTASAICFSPVAGDPDSGLATAKDDAQDRTPLQYADTPSLYLGITGSGHLAPAGVTISGMPASVHKFWVAADTDTALTLNGGTSALPMTIPLGVNQGMHVPDITVPQNKNVTVNLVTDSNLGNVSLATGSRLLLNTYQGRRVNAGNVSLVGSAELTLNVAPGLTVSSLTMPNTSLLDLGNTDLIVQSMSLDLARTLVQQGRTSTGDTGIASSHRTVGYADMGSVSGTEWLCGDTSNRVSCFNVPAGTYVSAHGNSSNAYPMHFRYADSYDFNLDGKVDAADFVQAVYSLCDYVPCICQHACDPQTYSLPEVYWAEGDVNRDGFLDSTDVEAINTKINELGSYCSCSNGCYGESTDPLQPYSLVLTPQNAQLAVDKPHTFTFGLQTSTWDSVCQSALSQSPYYISWGDGTFNVVPYTDPCYTTTTTCETCTCTWCTGTCTCYFTDTCTYCYSEMCTECCYNEELGCYEQCTYEVWHTCTYEFQNSCTYDAYDCCTYDVCCTSSTWGTAEITHTYDHPGQYNVVALLGSILGASTADVSQNGYATDGSATAVEGEPYQLTLDTPEGNDNAQWSLDWGDGSSGTVTITGTDAQTLRRTHTYTPTGAPACYSVHPMLVQSGATLYDPGASTVNVIPRAPLDVRADAKADGSVDVTWTGRSEMSSLYRLEKSINGGVWLSVTESTSNTKATLTGLTTGSYAFRVKALGGSSGSFWVQSPTLQVSSANGAATALVLNTGFDDDTANWYVRRKPGDVSIVQFYNNQEASGTPIECLASQLAAVKIQGNSADNTLSLTILMAPLC